MTIRFEPEPNAGTYLSKYDDCLRNLSSSGDGDPKLLMYVRLTGEPPKDENWELFVPNADELAPEIPKSLLLSRFIEDESML